MIADRGEGEDRDAPVAECGPCEALALALALALDTINDVPKPLSSGCARSPKGKVVTDHSYMK